MTFTACDDVHGDTCILFSFLCLGLRLKGIVFAFQISCTNIIQTGNFI